jgi:hypothetical protein
LHIEGVEKAVSPAHVVVAHAVPAGQSTACVQLEVHTPLDSCAPSRQIGLPHSPGPASHGNPIGRGACTVMQFAHPQKYRVPSSAHPLSGHPADGSPSLHAGKHADPSQAPPLQSLSASHGALQNEKLKSTVPTRHESQFVSSHDAPAGTRHT